MRIKESVAREIFPVVCRGSYNDPEAQELAEKILDLNESLRLISGKPLATAESTAKSAVEFVETSHRILQHVSKFGLRIGSIEYINKCIRTIEEHLQAGKSPPYQELDMILTIAENIAQSRKDYTEKVKPDIEKAKQLLQEGDLLKARFYSQRAVQTMPTDETIVVAKEIDDKCKPLNLKVSKSQYLVEPIPFEACDENASLARLQAARTQLVREIKSQKSKNTLLDTKIPTLNSKLAQIDFELGRRITKNIRDTDIYREVSSKAPVEIEIESENKPPDNQFLSAKLIKDEDESPVCSIRLNEQLAYVLCDIKHPEYEKVKDILNKALFEANS